MFKFNASFKDLTQVKRFYPAFIKIYNQLKVEGKYPYNSLFKDKIKGIKGDDEDTAIYLLQTLQTQKSRENKIENLLERGYKELKGGKETQKFESVVMVGTDHSKDSTKEFEKAKVMFDKGFVNFIIPKGYSKRGVMIYGDRQVFAR